MSQSIARLDNAGFQRLARRFSLGPITHSFVGGTVTGLVGLNGSGKSTLLRLLSGEFLFHRGVVTYPALCGNILDWECIKLHVRYLPSADNYFGDFSNTVADAISSSAAKYLVFGRKNLRRTRELIERFGLNEYAGAAWDELSDGYKHRVGIARALAGFPKLLLLDEPTANLDVVSRRVVLNEIADITKKEGIATVVATQDISNVELVSDEMLVLDNGRVAYSGPLTQIGANQDKTIFDVALSVRGQDAQALIDRLPSAVRPDRIISDRVRVTAFFLRERNVSSNSFVSALLESNASIVSFRDLTNSSESFVEWPARVGR